ncbi:MAG: serine hydrolase domain-containing protein [Bacteroidota bacterium]
MKYILPVIFIGFVILSLQAYSQVSNVDDPIYKSIDKRGKAFLKNSNITSVSIGVFKEGGIYNKHFGEIERGTGNAPTDETIYEIASVTKTMTGYLAAKAVLDEKIKLEDDVRSYLNEDYSNLAYEDNPIRIKHLLTHTSGLPMSLPLEMKGVFDKLSETAPEEYYDLEKSYSKAKFLEDLKTINVTIEPGSKYQYSNVGAELMGYILEIVYQKSLGELFNENIFQKAEMPNTAIELSDSQQEKLVKGYWMSNGHFSPNSLDKLWGAGSGIKSTLPDLLNYVKFQLDTTNNIVSESHKMLYTDGKALKIAYFWRVREDRYGRSYNHHGGTSGMQNWLFVFPKYGLGLSIITNHSGPKTPNYLSKTIKKILKDIIR